VQLTFQITPAATSACRLYCLKTFNSACSTGTNVPFAKVLQLHLTQSHCCCEGVAASMSSDQDERQHSHAQAGPSNASVKQPNGCASNDVSPSQLHHGSANGAEQEAGPLPMLASACPGWVCYAEKTHGSYILPYISTTKSPQVGSALTWTEPLAFSQLLPAFSS